MQARYAMQLEAEASSVKGGQLSDMEREQYQKQIKDLLQAVETLLKSNNALGERVAQLEKVAEAHEDLKVRYAKLEGELAMRKRSQHGKKSEKPKDTPESDSASDGSKDADEDKYIENGSKNDVPPTDDDRDEEEEYTAPAEPQEKKPRDLSNRPDHYNTMHADICVVHDCDLEKLKGMGLEFIRYTRPVDQFDRVSLTRQDRYLYVWVRDKNGNEFPFFIPKSMEDEKRECIFVNESKYDTPCLVPHTSATYSMISDLGVNRFRKALIAYIDVGSVLIDNNCCERAVRPFTNLRKSFGGFSSEKGGEVAAAWLTFIETCKLQKKAALDFFNGFFKSVTEGRSDYELIAQDVLG